MEARQLLQQQLSVTRTAGHQAAELILLAASSSAALAQNDLPTAKMTAEEGVALVKRLGSSFEKSNRKLLLQLLIAKGNAQLMDQNLPEAAKAAVEALTVGRASHDEEGQCEALHLICLLHLVFGRSAAQKAVAQVFHEGTPPLSSLESSNQAAALLRKLGDKEGEAIALLSIAECRLEAPNRPEALGAAQRARQLFREERHRRGRLQALELMARAWQETLPALEATEEELVLFKEEGDEAGQVDALRTLADFYTSARMYGEARSAIRKALELLADKDAVEKEVKSFMLLSHIEEITGRTDEAVKMAERALSLSKRSADALSLSQARRLVSRLYVQTGKSQDAPNRREALESLRDLTEAVRKRDDKLFQATMSTLEELSGYTEADVKSALVVEDDPDQASLMRFLKQQGQMKSAARGSSTVMAALSHALLYLSFRLGGLGYGPRFRRCYAYGVKGQDEDDMTAVAYLRHLSSQEEWSKNMEIQPPMLDSMQHSFRR